MSSNEPLFGFNVAQKLSLAEYIAANSGGGDGTVGGLPVVPGFIAPPVNGDLWVIFEGLDGLFITNYPSAEVVEGQTITFLETLPDYNAAVAQTLQHDATGVIKWVDNP